LIGQRVKKLRAQRGWSVAELSERAGVTDRIIRYYESGERRNPSLASLQALAAAFEVPVADLLADPEPEVVSG
jgi:XRE family transcriptional regulator of biofilm formation